MRKSWDSVVGTATRYGLDDPAIGFLLWRYLPHRADRLWTVQRPWRGVNHPSQSNVEVKERVELCLCSPSGHTIHGLYRANFALSLVFVFYSLPLCFPNSVREIVYVILLLYYYYIYHLHHLKEL